VFEDSRQGNAIMMGNVDRSRSNSELLTPGRASAAHGADRLAPTPATEGGSSLGLRMLAGALGVGVLALVVGLTVRSNATATRVRELSAQLARVGQRDANPQPVVVREIRTEVAVPTVSARPVAEPREADASPPAAADPTSELAQEEHEHRLLVFNQARLASCEKAYAAEAPDPEWSASAVRTIREKFSDDTFKPLKMSVDCRATLCRLDFSYENAETGLNASRAMMATGPWSGTRFSRLDQEKREGTVFLAREDFDIPSVDPASLEY
jgi:hypothetical protein